MQGQHKTKSPFPAFLSGRILTNKLAPGAHVQSCRGIIPQGEVPPAKSSRLALASPLLGEGLLTPPGAEALSRALGLADRGRHAGSTGSCATQERAASSDTSPHEALRMWVVSVTENHRARGGHLRRER